MSLEKNNKNNKYGEDDHNKKAFLLNQTRLFAEESNLL